MVLWISVVNVFNRVNVATRQVPGERLPQPTPNSGIGKHRAALAAHRRVLGFLAAESLLLAPLKFYPRAFAVGRRTQ